MSGWQVAELPRPTTDAERLKADIRGFGYAVIADALDPDQVEQIRTRIAEQAAAERARGLVQRDQTEEHDDVNQWVYLLINKGTVFQQLLTHPPVRALVDYVLGPEHVLSDLAAHITWPGNRLMPLHIDQWWMPPPALPGEEYVRPGAITRADVPVGDPTPADRPIAPPAVTNVMWMLSDFTTENGATRVVPRSHLSGRQPDPGREYDTVQVTAPAGSALVWEGRTWHGAGYNRSQGPRYGIVTYFGGPQFRQMSNFTYGLRPEVLATMPEALRPLLGFKVWSGYGTTGDPRAEFAAPGSEAVGELRPR